MKSFLSFCYKNNGLAQSVSELNNNLAYSQVALTTYLNGYAAYGSGSTIEKIGKLVILRLLINSTYATISPYTPIAVLPDGYKPILDTLGSSGVGIDGIHREIGVLSNGNIIVGNSQFAALSSFAATVIYFTN